MDAMVAHGTGYFHRAPPVSGPSAQLDTGVVFGAPL
jgi:hypothetical protein